MHRWIGYQEKDGRNDHVKVVRATRKRGKENGGTSKRTGYDIIQGILRKRTVSKRRERQIDTVLRDLMIGGSSTRWMIRQTEIPPKNTVCGYW